MSILNAIKASIEAFREARVALPAEIMLASDKDWDRLSDELATISWYGATGWSRSARIQVLGVEIICPRIAETRQGQAYLEGQQIMLTAHGPEMVRAELERMGIGK